MNIAKNPYPNAIGALVESTARFSDVLKRLSSNEPGSASVAPEADRLSAVVKGMADALVSAPLDDNEVALDHLDKTLEPIVEGLAPAIGAFDDDTCRGLCDLPDRNDLEIGMDLMWQNPDDVHRMGVLLAQGPHRFHTPERAELAGLLGNAAPLKDEIQPGPGGTVKLLLIILIILIVRARPKKINLVIIILIILFRIDRSAQKQTPQPPLPGPDVQPTSVSRISDSRKFKVRGTGTDPDPVKSATKAHKDAREKAEKTCDALGGEAELTFIERLRTVRNDDGTFTTEGRYCFVCKGGWQ